jgi:hypothetical protein
MGAPGVRAGAGGARAGGASPHAPTLGAGAQGEAGGGIQAQLVRSPAQAEAQGELTALGWAISGWLVPVYLLLAGYYVLRFQVRKRVKGRGHPESLFIAGLAASWAFVGVLVVGVASRPVVLAGAGVGALFGSIFLLTVVDNLRRHGLGIRRNPEENPHE